jgi:signal transduction histidine kinase
MHAGNISYRNWWTVQKYTVVFLCYVLVIVLFASLLVVYGERRQMACNDSRLASAARGLKYMLAEDFHDRAVDADSITLEEELRNREAISGFAAEAGFIYAYTLVEKDGEFFFAAPTVTEEEAQERERWYFYPYEDVPEGFVRSMQEGVETYSTYTDQWGTFRSVAIPETTPEGRRYLACVDMDISHIKHERAVNFVLAASAALLLVLTSLPLLLLHRRASKLYVEELSRMNADISQSNERLRTVDALKSSLLTKVSHELRTPLTSILGFVKLTARDFERHFAPQAKDNPVLSHQAGRIAANLKTVVDECGRLTRLLNDCLDLSKIESGRMEWHDMPLSPAMAAERAIAAMRGEQEAKPGVALLAEVEPDLPDIHADPDKIHQLLINLLGNAMKFTEQGSVTLRVLQEGGLVSMEVSDTGMGIKPEDQERIFDEFYRTLQNDTVQDIRKGTGMGLAICKQIVERYGGTITVRSEYGRGSTFCVLLPRRE